MVLTRAARQAAGAPALMEGLPAPVRRRRAARALVLPVAQASVDLAVGQAQEAPGNQDVDDGSDVFYDVREHDVFYDAPEASDSPPLAAPAAVPSLPATPSPAGVPDERNGPDAPPAFQLVAPGVVVGLTAAEHRTLAEYLIAMRDDRGGSPARHLSPLRALTARVARGFGGVPEWMRLGFRAPDSPSPSSSDASSSHSLSPSPLARKSAKRSLDADASPAAKRVRFDRPLVESGSVESTPEAPSLGRSPPVVDSAVQEDAVDGGDEAAVRAPAVEPADIDRGADRSNLPAENRTEADLRLARARDRVNATKPCTPSRLRRRVRHSDSPLESPTPPRRLRSDRGRIAGPSSLARTSPLSVATAQSEEEAPALPTELHGFAVEPVVLEAALAAFKDDGMPLDPVVVEAVFEEVEEEAAFDGDAMDFEWEFGPQSG